jgi:hypothetical protein
MSRIIEVREFHEGLRGGDYYFVVDDRRLIHISRYALSERKSHGISWYRVDTERIKDKTIIEFSSRAEGLIGNVFASLPPSKVDIWIFPAEELSNRDKKGARNLPITIINEYELAHLEAKEKSFLNEWDKYYKPMLNYIKREVIERGGKLLATVILYLHIVNDLKYPVSFLIPYSEKARFMHLNDLTKEIHQAWIVTRILREFTSQHLMLSFEKSSWFPIAIVDDYAMWYEFDLDPERMFDGIPRRKNILSQFMEMAIYKRACEVKKRLGLKSLPLKPDIVFTYAKEPREFTRNPAIKLLIECKNFDYSSWERDVENQVKPYMEIFRPEHMAVASLKPVPQDVKKALACYGIDVIDNVYPEGLGEQELITYVKRALGIETKTLKLIFPSFDESGNFIKPKLLYKLLTENI